MLWWSDTFGTKCVAKLFETWLYAIEIEYDRAEKKETVARSSNNKAKQTKARVKKKNIREFERNIVLNRCLLTLIYNVIRL